MSESTSNNIEDLCSCGHYFCDHEAKDMLTQGQCHGKKCSCLRFRAVKDYEFKPVDAPVEKKQFGGDHYVKAKIQPWDVVDTWPREQRIGFYRGGALKYLMRMGSKDEEKQEIEKGNHYLEKLLSVLKEKD